MLLTLFHKPEREGTLQNFFYKATNILIQKPSDEIYRVNFPDEHRQKLAIKYVQTRFYKTLKVSHHHRDDLQYTNSCSSRYCTVISVDTEKALNNEVREDLTSGSSDYFIWSNAIQTSKLFCVSCSFCCCETVGYCDIQYLFFC